ncbi:MAG: methyltransferase domain-containing protein [Spirochaetia bacterium]|nr:methyltransferase domain-containing protein [Spirochaetia bacterium]
MNISLSMKNEKIQKKLTEILTQRSRKFSEIEKNYILPFEPSNFPYFLKKNFNQYNGFILEIGSGWGEFTLELAKQNRDSLIIALEKKKKRIIRSIKNQKKENIENIRWMLLDVSWYFEDIFAENSFDHIIINFPDPWPKKKHHKHRILTENFLNSITNISKNGTLFEFASDYWPYIYDALFVIENSKYWQNINGKGVLLNNIKDRPESYFQKLKTEEGENTYFLQAEKL